MNIREHNMLEMWIMAVEKTNYHMQHRVLIVSSAPLINMKNWTIVHKMERL
jgi:hypothetical protein